MNFFYREYKDMKHDILLDSIEIKLNIGSYHKVKIFKSTSGEFKNVIYYVFKSIDGLSVMNYSPNEYYELSKFIDISFDYPIVLDCNNNTITTVPFNYRINQADRCQFPLKINII